MQIYLDGRYVIVDQQRLERLAPGKVPGKGVFETMIAVGGKIVFYNEHIRRLRRGLKFFHIPLITSSSQISSIIKQLMHQQNLLDARVRVMVWRDKHKVRESIVVSKLIRPTAKKYQTGYRLLISSDHRNLTASSHLKSIDYKLFHQAHAAAVAKGFDEALLVNDKSDVVETAYANIFVVDDGKIITPPSSSGCLEGITRRIVLRLAKKAGLKCMAKPFSAEIFSTASEVFLTNSVIGVMPVKSIDQTPFKSRRVGPITRRLMDLYHY